MIENRATASASPNYTHRPNITMPKTYLCNGLGCCWHGLDCEEAMICCKSQGECLFCVNQCCCAYTAKTKRCGPMMPNPTNGERLKVGCYCGTCALKPKPENLCAGASKICCCVQVYSVPLDKDYIVNPVVGCCCVQCYPSFEVCTSYPDSVKTNKFRGTGTPLPQCMSR